MDSTLTHPHPLTVYQLMTPRFEVLQNYPFSPFKYNEVVTLTQGGTKETSYHQLANVMVMTFGIFQNYPDIFREMAWYEQRELKDMPMYIKLADDSQLNDDKHPQYQGVFIPSLWAEFEAAEKQYFNKNYCHFYVIINNDYTKKLSGAHFVPATEEEFITYQRSHLL